VPKRTYKGAKFEKRLLVPPEVFWPQGLQGEHLSCDSNRPASGASEWATEESVFATVLATRSFSHLRLMFRVFRSVTGRDIEAVIEQHFSGKLRKGFLSIGTINQFLFTIC
jgi:hypothetical protein